MNWLPFRLFLAYALEKPIKLVLHETALCLFAALDTGESLAGGRARGSAKITGRDAIQIRSTALARIGHEDAATQSRNAEALQRIFGNMVAHRNNRAH